MDTSLGILDEGLPVDLDSLFTAKFTASADMAEGDYTFGLKDIVLSDWNGEDVPYTAEGASVHVTELPKEPQLLTVQWSGNASMSVEGECGGDHLHRCDLWREGTAGRRADLHLHPDGRRVLRSAAQRRGHRVCSGRLHVHLHDAGREHDPALHVHKRG